MFEVFFDSDGSGWATCAVSHPEAQAFGPSGASRPLTVEEVRLLRLGGGPSHQFTAAGQRRVVEGYSPDDWDWLPDGGALLALAGEIREAFDLAIVALDEGAGCRPVKEAIRKAKAFGMELEVPDWVLEYLANEDRYRAERAERASRE